MSVEWTEESVLPHLFKMVQVSDDGIIWRSAKLVGFSYENGQQTFIMDMS
jgi:hypothetical protein